MTDQPQNLSDWETQSDRRRQPRYMVVAVAQFRPSGGNYLTGRVTKISRGGCFIECLNTFPVGTPVTLHIVHAMASFTTEGTVLYIQHDIGMGVKFVDTSAEQLTTLDTLLAVASEIV